MTEAVASTKPTKTYVSSLDKLPPGDHWVILEFDTTYVPGDDRSSQFPGHGYTGHDLTVVRYVAFTNVEEWKTEVTKRTVNGNKKVAALVVNRATVTVDVNVGVNCGSHGQ